jgi:hypothetical protein
LVNRWIGGGGALAKVGEFTNSPTPPIHQLQAS